MALPATAQEHFDVLLYEDADGNLAAGGVDVDSGGAFPGIRVIEGELFGDTLAGSSTYEGDDPGFFSYSDTQVGAPPIGFPAGADNLPGNAEVSLDFLLEPTLNSSLSLWNDGAGMWEPVLAGQQISMTTDFDAGPNIIDGASVISDMVLDFTSSTGFLDDHPEYELSGTGNPTGVYLAYGQASVAGVSSPSDPFWFVFGTLDACELTETCDAGREAFNEGIEEQIESAIAYTEAVLVPEPSTGVLLALGLGLLGRAGTRRRG